MFQAKHQRIKENVSCSVAIKEEPTESMCPITQMYATNQFFNEMPVAQVAEPPMEINVKVEVERFDENEPERVRRIHEEIDFDEKAFRKRFKNKRFLLSNNMVGYAADKIIKNSKNIADHILNVAVRNTSGHILRRDFHRTNPWDDRIQSALDEWKEWQRRNFIRDGPLFYKCYYCRVSYWYLEDFKEHLSGHKLLNVTTEYHTLHEVNIVAYHNICPTRAVLPAIGNCGRCGKGYKDHSLMGTDKAYSCHGCSKTFHTCLSLGFHISTCTTLGLPRTRIRCEICKLEIPTVNNLEHLLTVHMVRSDIPIMTRHCLYDTCNQCTERYINKNAHLCFICTIHRCKMCFRSFPTEYLLKLHVEQYKEPYKCPICGQILQNGCTKYEHMLYHSNNYTLVVKCMLCIKFNIFLNNKGLLQHMQSNHIKGQSNGFLGVKVS